MKKPRYYNHIILLLCLLLSGFTVHAQNELRPKIYAALQAYIDKEYLKSAQLYSEDLIERHYRAPSDKMLYAARMWALAGQPDSAFTQLNRMTKGNDTQALGDIFADDAFDQLKNDIRWKSLTELLKSKGIKPEQAVKKNYMLNAGLAVMNYNDQHYRTQSIEADEKYGANSPIAIASTRTMMQYDSINQQKVKGIIDKYDWPRGNEIDKEGSITIWEVIQHAGLAMKIKYLQEVKDAVKKGLLQGSYLALLEDRINTFQHKKQVYGTQLVTDPTGKNYLQPLQDPENVDKRRAEVGLPPIKEYLKQFKIDWDIEQYKKDLPHVEELVKHVSW